MTTPPNGMLANGMLNVWQCLKVRRLSASCRKNGTLDRAHDWAHQNGGPQIDLRFDSNRFESQKAIDLSVDVLPNLASIIA